MLKNISSLSAALLIAACATPEQPATPPVAESPPPAQPAPAAEADPRPPAALGRAAPQAHETSSDADAAEDAAQNAAAYTAAANANAPAGSPKPAQTDTGRFRISIASADNAESAAKWAKKAEAAGYRTEILEVAIDGKTYQRVLLPGYASLDDAQAALPFVQQELGAADAWVTSRRRAPVPADAAAAAPAAPATPAEMPAPPPPAN